MRGRVRRAASTAVVATVDARLAFVTGRRDVRLRPDVRARIAVPRSIETAR